MTGSIYLIGGGEIRLGETKQIDEDIKSLAHAGSTFVFIGFAAQDNVGYSDTIKSVFGDKFKTLVPTKEKGRDYAINAIKSSSIVYLGGGDTDLLLGLFSDWDLVKHLSAALKRGSHVVGMSAGAQALSSWYIHEEGHDMEVRKGWGFASVCTLVHANRDSLEKAKSLWVNFHGQEHCPFVAISESAAWRVNTSEEQTIGSGHIWRVDS